ncbi:hypothetical protein NW762_011109 [Fusarium torreyae]|uniref:Uncharacterized protein n=1 Tax=Fusarium torreyae TaxID=1237075 RepID=A0A9W8RSX6_9HYPO|nr:hypothetical protein NW762_011109 [Fusarium torreyae]
MSLREEDASVDPPDPEADGINGVVLDGLPFAFPTDMMPSQPTLVPLAQLSQIAESIMTELFATKLIKLPREKLVSHRVMKLEELNVRLFQWHTSLPEALTWNQWMPTTERLPPWLAIVQ